MYVKTLKTTYKKMTALLHEDDYYGWDVEFPDGLVITRFMDEDRALECVAEVWGAPMLRARKSIIGGADAIAIVETKYGYYDLFGHYTDYFELVCRSLVRYNERRFRYKKPDGIGFRNSHLDSRKFDFVEYLYSRLEEVK